MKISCIHAGTIIVITVYSNIIIVSLKRNEIPRCLTDLLILTLVWRLLFITIINWVIYFSYNITASIYSYIPAQRLKESILLHVNILPLVNSEW